MKRIKLLSLIAVLALVRHGVRHVYGHNDNDGRCRRHSNHHRGSHTRHDFGRWHNRYHRTSVDGIFGRLRRKH